MDLYKKMLLFSIFQAQELESMLTHTPRHHLVLLSRSVNETAALEGYMPTRKVVFKLPLKFFCFSISVYFKQNFANPVVRVKELNQEILVSQAACQKKRGQVEMKYLDSYSNSEKAWKTNVGHDLQTLNRLKWNSFDSIRAAA